MKPWLSKGLKSSQELPLRRDDTSRFLPWIISVMVFLSALSLAFAMLIHAATGAWDTSFASTLTVQVPPPSRSDTKAMPIDKRMEKILGVLNTTQGVQSSTPVDPREAKDLLETWLGRGNVVDDLPVPRLIDVQLEPEVDIDLTSLTEKIEAAVPGATLDDHKLWLDNLLQLGERLEGAAYGVLMIVAMAAFVVVVFATRSSLVAHNRTIELLHIMGAEDSYIAHQFSRRAFYMGLIGGAIGLVAASIVLYIVGTSASGLEEGWLPKMQAVKDVNISDVTPITWTEAWIPEWLRDNWAFVLYLLLLPLISGILSLMCTWITVMARLRRVI